MNIKKYFEREYNFLQQEGEKFAEKHQGIAGELRMSQRHRKDPFVERLFEAFAFLAGRIHEKLDDDFPEITGGLLEQLFPHFLRPFPSCAILEARPIARTLTKPVLVKRGCEVQTPPGRYQVKYKVTASPREKARIIEKTEPAEFIFRTTQDMMVRPMELKSVRVEDLPDANSALVLKIHPHRNVDYESLVLDRLTLFLHGSDYLRYTLLLYLTKYVSGLHVREIAGDTSNFHEIKPFKIGIPGLSDELDEDTEEFSIIPYARQTFSGYRLLQEYFAFPQRFFFIGIEGLNSFSASKDGHPFEIKINFNRSLSAECKPTNKDLLLHCTPIVNLFDRPTEEIIVDQRLPEYYILPDGDRRKSREIYSVKQVTGVSEDKLQQYQYLPVTSYDILDTSDPQYDYKRFFSVVTRPIKGDMAETYIRIFGSSMEEDPFPKETLSIGNAILTNGFLPAKYLEANSINQPINFPEGIEASNLTTPTNVFQCPNRQNYLWTLISHLTLSYTTLADAEIFRSILSLYNWSEEDSNKEKKKIQAITKIHPPSTRYILRGQGLIRGIEFKIEIDETQFENGEGDIQLFGTVINRFLSQYVTINSFAILSIIETGSNRRHTWHPKLGKVLPV
ncbi:MAG: type VI secretion system baseplate subunit TssF [Candidatus Hodarchaeota archaeon]